MVSGQFNNVGQKDFKKSISLYFCIKIQSHLLSVKLNVKCAFYKKLDPNNILPSTHQPIFNLKRRANGTELRLHARESIWLLTLFTDLTETKLCFIETTKYSRFPSSFLRLLCLNLLRPPEFPDEQTAALVAKVTVNIGEQHRIK